MRILEIGSLEKMLTKSLNSSEQSISVISQFLKRQTPLHFGGMSDPFMPYEAISKTSLSVLDILSQFKYPTIISTKGKILREDNYIDKLSKGKFVIQVSFSTLNDRKSKLLERNTILPSERLKVIKEISQYCKVSARLQPVIPGNEAEIVDAISLLKDAGTYHISVEFLKIPLVNSASLLNSVSKIFEIDVAKYYSDKRIVGLEYLVNRNYALKSHIEFIQIANSVGLGYSSADTDFLPYDKSDCCCSGVHDLPGFNNYYTHTYSNAIRNALKSKSRILKYDHLDSEWVPNGPINQFLNSKNRIPNKNSIKGWMAFRWNNPSKSIGPNTFFGIETTDAYDENQMRVYKISSDAFRLAKSLNYFKDL
jgi:DNA repair photolyase